MRARFALFAVLAPAALALLLSGCGLFAPDRRDAVRQRDAYVKLAKKHTTHDELFFFNELRASMIMDVLNFGPDLLTAARLRWSSDKAFTDALAKWMPEGRGRTVFVGIYSRGFKPEEVLKNPSYSFRLKAQSGLYEPDFIGQVKEPYLSSYLPVFNHWEKVFAVHFPADSSIAGASIVVDFPEATRELPLAQ